MSNIGRARNPTYFTTWTRGQLPNRTYKPLWNHYPTLIWTTWIAYRIHHYQYHHLAWLPPHHLLSVPLLLHHCIIFLPLLLLHQHLLFLPLLLHRYILFLPLLLLHHPHLLLFDLLISQQQRDLPGEEGKLATNLQLFWPNTTLSWLQ